VIIVLWALLNFLPINVISMKKSWMVRNVDGLSTDRITPTCTPVVRSCFHSLLLSCIFCDPPQRPILDAYFLNELNCFLFILSAEISQTTTLLKACIFAFVIGYRKVTTPRKFRHPKSTSSPFKRGMTSVTVETDELRWDVTNKNENEFTRSDYFSLASCQEARRLWWRIAFAPFSQQRKEDPQELHDRRLWDRDSEMPWNFWFYVTNMIFLDRARWDRGSGTIVILEAEIRVPNERW
jgi:hypothetical protein